METIKSWQVIEDNGGGLHLAIFDGGECRWFFPGFENGPQGELVRCIEALSDGTADPNRWDGCSEIAEDEYDDLLSYDYGWRVIADEDGSKPDLMGAAGKREFGITE